MDYTSLDLDHKRELLVNFRAAMLAISALSTISHKKAEFWTKEFFVSAYLQVNALSESQVDQAIVGIEKDRSTFKNDDNDESTFCISVLEVEKHEN